MADTLIFAGSITYAMKIKDILNNGGIHAVIRRKQNKSMEKGCSYGVYVSGNIEKANQLIKSSGINIVLEDGMEGHDDLS